MTYIDNYLELYYHTGSSKQAVELNRDDFKQFKKTKKQKDYIDVLLNHRIENDYEYDIYVNKVKEVLEPSQYANLEKCVGIQHYYDDDEATLMYIIYHEQTFKEIFAGEGIMDMDDVLTELEKAGCFLYDNKNDFTAFVTINGVQTRVYVIPFAALENLTE